MSERISLARRLTAEFFVIVLGVMIALAADRAIQAADDRALEQEYLALLLDDFQLAVESIQITSGYAEERLGYAEIVTSAVEGTLDPSVDAQDLALAIGLVHWFYDPPVPRTVWAHDAFGPAQGHLA